MPGKKVEGVRYRKDGNERAATADKVVLSAGVYHSPQILMLSGIGPRAELERHGIPVVRALEGVGENYQDHPVVTMTLGKNSGGKGSARPLDLEALKATRRASISIFTLSCATSPPFPESAT